MTFWEINFHLGGSWRHVPTEDSQRKWMWFVGDCIFLGGSISPAREVISAEICKVRDILIRSTIAKAGEEELTVLGDKWTFTMALRSQTHMSLMPFLKGIPFPLTCTKLLWSVHMAFWVSLIRTGWWTGFLIAMEAWSRKGPCKMKTASQRFSREQSAVSGDGGGGGQIQWQIEFKIHKAF